MNNKHVMQQALKALNDSVYLVSEYYNEAVELYYNQPFQQINLAALNTDVAAHKAAITALEAAIAQPQQPVVQGPVAYRWTEFSGIGGSPVTRYADIPPGHITDAVSLYTAIAQPVEPAEAPLTPGRWMLVPIKPTSQMLESSSIASDYEVSQSRAKVVYTAMLNAVVQPVESKK